MHHDVDAVGQLFDQLRGSVLGADVEGDATSAEACGEGVKVGPGWRNVEQDDLGAVTGQGLGDGGANTARSAGDQRLASGQGARPVRHLGVAGIQANHLPGHEGAFR
ncbi:hypothetical protein D3C76_1582600 [compost metagenome]